MLFFHPAIWWLQSRLALEREMACDECVLAETGNARAYAKSLATIAERSFAQRSLVRRTIALAQAAVSRLHHTTMRVTKILSPAPRKSHSTAMMVASAAAFGGISVAVAMFTPNVVGFTESAPVVASDVGAPMLHPAIFKPASMNLQAGSLPRVTLTAAKESRPRKQLRTPLVRTKQFVAKPAELPTLARAEKRPPLFAPGFVPVKATRDQVISAQPAMLVVWQETYSDDGSVVTIQQSYWRVVVLKNVTPKEQPAKTT